MSKSQYQAGRPIGAKTKIATIITSSRNVVPQRGCRREKRSAFAGVSGMPASKQEIVLCSAPWYSNTRRRSRRRRERQQVAEEDPRAQQALDEPEEERGVELVLDQRRDADRDQEEQADREQIDDTIVPAHMPLEISCSSSGSWALAEMPSALKPTLIDSPSAMTPRMTGRRSSDGV